ncbi:hypothetical protein [Bradyrhizobium sp. SZCCHNRI20481]|uniref:hypothetical protein n=1 Tax=Bradyrhizobium sp. SZCCHNRI20481 TaxID=3057286 RepID=UPI002915E0FA|nr:hypothetical protein [Bradyrhizobium sp. SZCCHNRI20481]
MTRPVHRISGFFLTSKGVRFGELCHQGGTFISMTAEPRTPDARDDMFLPGFVDLHAGGFDVIQGERAGVDRSLHRNLLHHDALMAAAGITTGLTTVALDNLENDGTAIERAIEAIDLLKEAISSEGLRSRHMIHLRCELTDDGVLEAALPIIETYRDQIAVVSAMDHSCGRRQFRSREKWREAVAARLRHDQGRIAAAFTMRAEAAVTLYWQRAAELAASARYYGVRFMTHDDATAQDVKRSHALGSQLCEFPTTLEAASAAAGLGLPVLAGAPNFVRGESYVGNVSVRDLHAASALSILSYDYAPFSLIEAAAKLFDLGDAQSIGRFLSGEAGRFLGLPIDDGLQAGQPADFIRVQQRGGTARVVETWRGGQRVA